MQDGQYHPDISKTPESPLTSNLHDASATIDDLTLALANFSRIPSPEPPSAFTCCCGKDDCENTKAWLTFKSDLESRLILSAEVGQALLQRHEAYVRRQEGHHTRPCSESSPARGVKVESQDRVYVPQEPVNSLADDLLREKAALEKRLNQALVNNEVAEVSNKTLLHELQEARVAVSRLTAHHVRSVGWDARLMAVMQERDDMQQERDSEVHKAKQAEVRIVALNARVSKLQLEVQHLREGIEQRRLHRLESSESILQDARARLEVLQNSQLGHTAMAEETEIMKVLESLVEDNEAFKRDNAELQRLLTESREDYHILQEEVEEQRANPPHTVPQFKSFFLTPSGLPSPTRPSSTTGGNFRRNFEPTTPETDRRPLSPSNSLTPSETNSTAFSHAQSRYLASHVEIEEQSQDFLTLEKPQPHKPLFLLSRSRGVQTDVWLGAPAPYSPSTHLRSPSLHDPRSESSSMTDSQPSNMTVLVERVVSLLNRMTQANALTLMNRLKRQNLKGADLGHLSRVTVGGIVSDASNLRVPFRALLEDDKVTTTWTRKDLRGLFKLFKDTFVEMGHLRITLNDVILDPSVASKLRDQELNPSKGETATPGLSTGGWMAPISKLFGSSGGEGSVADRDLSSLGQEEGRGRAKSRPPHRVIPKLGPALSASTTTVNVEFSGTGVGRAVTSTIKAREGEATVGMPQPSSDGSTYHTSTSVMGIFAGAPRSSTPDPWVVLHKAPRAVHSTRPMLNPKNGDHMKRLSRNVDAVIDVSSPNQHESDTLPPLLRRTLRRRGLSDSSIHSTFMSPADESRLPPIRDTPSAGEVRPDKGSVLKALGRTVQNFKLTPSGLHATTGDVNGPKAHSSGYAVPSTSSSPPNLRASPLAALLPNISSWAGASAGLDPSSEPFYVGSHGRDESLLHQVRSHGSRDYF